LPKKKLSPHEYNHTQFLPEDSVEQSHQNQPCLLAEIQDLTVLAKHLFEEPGLITCRMLDESRNIIAYESIADCSGTLIGGPVWQPDAGMESGKFFSGVIDNVRIYNRVISP
jgi:hypothetical protein